MTHPDTDTTRQQATQALIDGMVALWRLTPSEEDARIVVDGMLGAAASVDDAQSEDQPDGIANDSLDLPEPKRAAERVREFLSEFGDGLVDTYWEDHLPPLYARDLEALSKLPAELADMTAQRDALIEASLDTDYTVDHESGTAVDDPDAFTSALANIAEMHRVLLVRLERLVQANDARDDARAEVKEFRTERDSVRNALTLAMPGRSALPTPDLARRIVVERDEARAKLDQDAVKAVDRARAERDHARSRLDESRGIARDLRQRLDAAQSEATEYRQAAEAEADLEDESRLERLMEANDARDQLRADLESARYERDQYEGYWQNSIQDIGAVSRALEQALGREYAEPANDLPGMVEMLRRRAETADGERGDAEQGYSDAVERVAAATRRAETAESGMEALREERDAQQIVTAMTRHERDTAQAERDALQARIDRLLAGTTGSVVVLDQADAAWLRVLVDNSKPSNVDPSSPMHWGEPGHRHAVDLLVNGSTTEPADDGKIYAVDAPGYTLSRQTWACAQYTQSKIGGRIMRQTEGGTWVSADDGSEAGWRYGDRVAATVPSYIDPIVGTYRKRIDDTHSIITGDDDGYWWQVRTDSLRPVGDAENESPPFQPGDWVRDTSYPWDTHQVGTVDAEEVHLRGPGQTSVDRIKPRITLEPWQPWQGERVTGESCHGRSTYTGRYDSDYRPDEVPDGCVPLTTRPSVYAWVRRDTLRPAEGGDD